jgi:hypothetical protein
VNAVKAGLVCFLAGSLFVGAAEPFQPFPVPGKDLLLTPESGRSLQRLIVGLEANSTKAYMIPFSAASSEQNKDRIRFLRRQLYMIRFELIHGNIVRALPAHTRLFTALPDPEFVVESRGNEAEIFAEYLKFRGRWTDAQIQKRVSFFKVSEPLVFPQDMAEVLGRDKTGRLILGMGEDTDPVYEQAAKVLTGKFPSDFRLHRFPTLNTEGGDMELVWTPEGSIALLLGQNRIRRFLETQKKLDLQGKEISSSLIESAQQAFHKEFFGIEVLMLGRKELENPRFISTEVFHIDMVSNILRSGRRVLAFVPTYGENPVSADTNLPLSEIIVKRAQYFYDETADTLKQRGYEIVRLPFRDHPVRNPVNVGKFTHPATGKSTIFLSKYPYHYPLNPGETSMQAKVQSTLDNMENAIDNWRNDPSESHWEILTGILKAVWKRFDEAEAGSHPVFEEQAKIYRANGIDVIPVVIYPISEGGIHCLLLK